MENSLGRMVYMNDTTVDERCELVMVGRVICVDAGGVGGMTSA